MTGLTQQPSTALAGTSLLGLALAGCRQALRMSRVELAHLARCPEEQVERAESGELPFASNAFLDIMLALWMAERVLGRKPRPGHQDAQEQAKVPPGGARSAARAPRAARARKSTPVQEPSHPPATSSALVVDLAPAAAPAADAFSQAEMDRAWQSAIQELGPEAEVVVEQAAANLDAWSAQPACVEDVSAPSEPAPAAAATAPPALPADPSQCPTCGAQMRRPQRHVGVCRGGRACACPPGSYVCVACREANPPAVRVSKNAHQGIAAQPLADYRAWRAREALALLTVARDLLMVRRRPMRRREAS